MGRKRIPLNQKRVTVTVSLPQGLIDRFDSSLNGRTRSRTLQGIIEASLKNNVLIEDFAHQHQWVCLDCSSSWRTNRPKNRTFVCHSKSCRSDKIEYVGLDFKSTI